MLPNDIYSIIVSFVPIEYLPNVFLAYRKLNYSKNERFWRHRLVIDYRVQYFPPFLTSLQLYKKYHSFHWGSAQLYQGETELGLLRYAIKNNCNHGDIIIVIDKYFILSRRIEVVRMPVSINKSFKLIEEYPLNYWDKAFDILEFMYIGYFDASPYKEQIEANRKQIVNNEFPFRYMSTFIDWRGEKYTISYSYASIYISTRYKIKDNYLFFDDIDEVD